MTTLGNSPIFSPFSVTTIHLDPGIQNHLAVEALTHVCSSMQRTAEADAQVLTARVLERLNDGIMERSSIGALFSAASNCALGMTANPMDSLPRALAERASEYSKRLQDQIPGWADDLISQLRTGGESMTLASQLSAAELRYQLKARTAELRQAIVTDQASAAALEVDLRKNCELITNTMAPPSGHEEKKKRFLESKLGGFLVPVILSAFIAGVVLVFGGAPFFPGPSAVLAGGLLWGFFSIRGQNVDEQKQEKDAPFHHLKRQVEQYSAQHTESLKHQRQLWHADGLLQRLEADGNLTLPLAFQDIRNVLAQWHNDIPSSVFAGESADYVYITGREIVEELWSCRTSSWSLSKFMEQLIKLSGKSTLEEIMNELDAEEAAELMRDATEATLRPPTLTEVISLLINNVPRGKEQLIGELRAHTKLLASLLPIQNYIAYSPDPACPTVFHFCLPLDLMNVLKPVLEQAVPRRSFDLYPEEYGDEIKCVFESFNWTLAERARFEIAQHSYASYLTIAIEQRWSAESLLETSSGKASTAIRLINEGVEINGRTSNFANRSEPFQFVDDTDGTLM